MSDKTHITITPPHQLPPIMSAEALLSAILVEVEGAKTLTLGEFISWILADNAALEDHIAKLEYKWESKEPGTQGAILDAFYALVPEGHEYDSSDPGPGFLRQHIAKLEAIAEAAHAVVVFERRYGVSAHVAASGVFQELVRQVEEIERERE